MKKIKLITVTVTSGNEVTNTHFEYGTNNGYERLAALVIAINALEDEKQKMIK